MHYGLFRAVEKLHSVLTRRSLKVILLVSMRTIVSPFINLAVELLVVKGAL